MAKMQTLTFDFAEGCFLEGDGQGTANRHGFLAMTFWAQAATVSLARSSLGSVRESVFVFALSRTKVICRVRFIPEPAEVLDFAKGIADLPRTNLLKYRFEDGSWIASARPAPSRSSRCTARLSRRTRRPPRRSSRRYGRGLSKCSISKSVGLCRDCEACCFVCGVLFLRMWYNDGVRICFKKGILT